MPKVKIPKRLHELADEIDVDLGFHPDFTRCPHELIAWMKFKNEIKRTKENKQRDDVDRELDELEAEMLENCHDA